MMKSIDRLFQYFDYKGIKPTRFEKEYGLSNGYLTQQLKRNADIGESILIKIINNCQDINPGWLLTGEGEMLKQIQQEQAPGQPHSEEYWKELIASQQRTIESQSRIIEQQSRSIQSFLARAGSTEAV